MQSNKQKPIDARTFVQIYQSMSRNQRQTLQLTIIDRLGVTHQTIWNWGTGKYQPVIPLMKNIVSKAIESVLGVRTTPQTLFP